MSRSYGRRPVVLRLTDDDSDTPGAKNPYSLLVVKKSLSGNTVSGKKLSEKSQREQSKQTQEKLRKVIFFCVTLVDSINLEQQM